VAHGLLTPQGAVRLFFHFSLTLRIIDMMFLDDIKKKISPILEKLSEEEIYELGNFITYLTLPSHPIKEPPLGRYATDNEMNTSVKKSADRCCEWFCKLSLLIEQDTARKVKEAKDAQANQIKLALTDVLEILPPDDEGEPSLGCWC
jgi:hypothetical protein